LLLLLRSLALFFPRFAGVIPGGGYPVPIHTAFGGFHSTQKRVKIILSFPRTIAG